VLTEERGGAQEETRRLRFADRQDILTDTLSLKPMMRSRPWTPADDHLVLTLPPSEAARQTGRTLAAVYIHRCKLKAADLKRPWSPAEDRLLMRLPPAMAQLYIKRTPMAMTQRRRALGLVKDRRTIRETF
jgi:hypothetical protein